MRIVITELPRALALVSIAFVLPLFGYSAQEGEADENGNWVVRDGKKASGGIAAAASGWGTEPLGAPGELGSKIDGLKHATYRKPQPFKPGLRLFGKGVKAVIVAPAVGRDDKQRVRDSKAAMRRLADEFAWHLGRMTGEEFPVEGELSKCTKPVVPTVVFADEATAKSLGVEVPAEPIGVGIIRRRGNLLVVTGTRSGQSHALTYMLEKFGCRYLYPGKGGKVIPKGLKEVTLPELDWTYAPDIRFRRLRMAAPREKDIASDRSGKAMRNNGMDPVAITKARIAARQDEDPANRDFMAWHGISDKEPYSGKGGALELGELDGEYGQGHSFRDYYARFSKRHPEFFALQPDGSREQGAKLGRKTDRATLCLSNRELAHVAAQDVIGRLKSSPGIRGASISLPDGGSCSQCMCEECRKLDPVNGVKTTMSFGSPVNATLPIVALSDRYVAFANRVAAEVKAEFPDRYLCCQAYAKYTVAPVRERPDPMLAIFSVAGDYRFYEGRDGALPFGDWAKFGNRLSWRPNLLRNWFSLMPQNFARSLFSDLRTSAANGVISVDFDCFTDEWGVFGLVYYMFAKGLNDPDGLDYETIESDYFEKGFGKAAKAMKAYWDVAARAQAECRKEKKSTLPPFVIYGKAVDFAALEKRIAEARTLAGGDSEILERIDFFAAALKPARLERRIVEAALAHDEAAGTKAQRELMEYVKKESAAAGLAVNPGRMLQWRTTPSLFFKDWKGEE